MATYVDDQGNEHEIELSLDEINEIKESLPQLKEKAEKADELNEKLKSQEEELSKLRNKDFNFKQFREAKDAEKEEMLKGFSEREKDLLRATESTSSELHELKRAFVSEHKEKILHSLAGNDDDLRKKIEETAKTFVGEPKTAQEFAERYTNAYTMIKGMKPEVNIMNRYIPVVDGLDPTGTSGPKKYVDTPEGKANYQSWFPDSKQDKKD